MSFINEKNVPQRMLPQKKISFMKYKQHKYKKALPTEYKRAAKALIILESKRNQLSIEELLDSQKSKVNKQILPIVQLVLNRKAEINYLIEKTNILSKNKVCKQQLMVLIGQLLWGTQFVKSGADQVELVKYYEEELREAFIEATDIICNPLDNDRFHLPTYVRINLLSISIEDTLCAFSKEGWTLIPRSNTYSEYLMRLANLGPRDFLRDYHISELLVFPPRTPFYDHPGYLKGKFVLQDKGSCLSSFLLNPKPESVVLDMCAAPGKKTNHLANIMGNTGLIIANDIHPDRFTNLNKLLELTNVKCANTQQDDLFHLQIDNIEDIKYILLDPSTTYSGIFFQLGRNMQKFGMQRKQFALNMILRFALQSFPNVKRVIFTTCSLYPQEAELVVDEALKEVGECYTLLNVKEMLWNEWESVSPLEFNCGGKCLRIVPEVDLCQGYFIAVFERNIDVPLLPYIRKFNKGGKAYTYDELQKVDKVNPLGKVIQTYVPLDKKVNRIGKVIKSYVPINIDDEGFNSEGIKLQNRISKVQIKQKNHAARKIMKHNKKRMTYINPKLLKPTVFQMESQQKKNSEITHNGMECLQEESCESFHSQLYP